MSCFGSDDRTGFSATFDNDDDDDDKEEEEEDERAMMVSCEKPEDEFGVNFDTDDRGPLPQRGLGEAWSSLVTWFTSASEITANPCDSNRPSTSDRGLIHGL